jgi:hypothetical protein
VPHVAVVAVLARVPVGHARVAVGPFPTVDTRAHAVTRSVHPAAGVAVHAGDCAAVDAKVSTVTSIAVLADPAHVAAGAVAGPVDPAAGFAVAARDVATAPGAKVGGVAIVAVLASPPGHAGRAMPAPVDTAASVDTVIARDRLVARRAEVLAVAVGAIGGTPVGLADDIETKGVGRLEHR